MQSVGKLPPQYRPKIPEELNMNNPLSIYAKILLTTFPATSVNL